MVAQAYYIIPNTLRNWPWKRGISPHFEVAKAQSVAWIESFRAFSPEAQIAFNKCNFSLLAALTYTKSNFYNFRSCCDLMHTFFVLDEYTDKMDAAGTKALCDASMDAIMNPNKPRPKGENVIGEISRQFWQRARRGAPMPAQERFVASWRRYLDSVVLQAERRTKSYVCTIDEYLTARRDNIGSDPSMALLEICLQINIPHEVMEHPAIASLTSYTADLNTLGNDICSYKREYLSNDADYNAVTVAMINNKTDLSGALQWISDLHDEIVDRFLKTRADVLAHMNGVPSWGKEIDRQVAAYIDGLGQWIRGSDEWNYGSGRYFGDEGPKIQQTRRVIIA